LSHYSTRRLLLKMSPFSFLMDDHAIAKQFAQCGPDRRDVPAGIGETIHNPFPLLARSQQDLRRAIALPRFSLVDGKPCIHERRSRTC